MYSILPTHDGEFWFSVDALEAWIGLPTCPEGEASVRYVLVFPLFDGDVAEFVDFVAERRHARVQVRHTNSGRPHIDASAVLPEVERRADDGDVGLSHGALKLRRAGRAREGDHVADIFHAGQVHHHTLQA